MSKKVIRTKLAPSQIVETIEQLMRHDLMPVENEQENEARDLLTHILLTELFEEPNQALLALRITMMAATASIEKIAHDNDAPNMAVAEAVFVAMRKYVTHEFDHHKTDCVCDTCYELVKKDPSKAPKTEDIDALINDILKETNND